MAPSKRGRCHRSSASQSRHSTLTSETKLFAIPYFAHQELDRVKYARAKALALPVGRPGWAPAPMEIATAANGGWNDDAEAPMDNDPDDNASIESTEKPPTNGYHALSSKRNPYQRLRINGGRPAVAKKVTADLDSDDEIIVRMKAANYLEKDIAEFLVNEGRTAYNPKTIGTRYARIKRAQAKHNDELLDAELTDWHDGDDDALFQAFIRADEITQKAKAEADARKWRIVADELKQIKPVTNFSQNACRSRFDALQAGIAKPTPESIMDPDDETVARILSRREKEARLQADVANLSAAAGMENIRGNAWTSKRRKYM